MTNVNIVAGGLSGIGSGLVVYYLIGSVALWLGDNIRLLIESTIQFSPALAGLVAGALIWPAIIGGVYHAAILPIVLLEMEGLGMSFVGAVDMDAVSLVVAGTRLATILLPRKR